MVRPERFELPTYCSGGNRSIHLSYGRPPIGSVYMGRSRSGNVGAHNGTRFVFGQVPTAGSRKLSAESRRLWFASV
jgi:hypothetical protein